MKGPWKTVLKCLIGFVVGAPLLWGLVLALLPTEWARARIEAALRASTGQDVELGEVRLDALGGLRLRSLFLSEAGHPDGAWFQADEVKIGLSVARLFLGRLEPAWVEARGAQVRLHRPVDGTFPSGQLLRARPTKQPGASGGREGGATATEIAFRVSDSRVEVFDATTRTRVSLTGLEGNGIWREHHVTLSQLAGKLNEGPFKLNAELVRGTRGPMFEVELTVREAKVAEASVLLGLVTPVLGRATPEAELQGLLDLNLYLRGQGDTSEELERSLVGQGALRLDQLSFEHRGLFAELGRIVKLPSDARIGTVHGQFRVGRGRIEGDPIVLEIGSLPLVLKGWSDFGGRFDYRVRSEALAALVAPELKSLIPELPAGLEDMLEVRLSGERGTMRVTTHGFGARISPNGQGISETEQLREIGRRLRDRILR